MKLGRLGVWSTGIRGRDGVLTAQAAADLETLGYGTLWFPPGTSRAFAIAQHLLTATSDLTVATGILSVWTQEPSEVEAGFAALQMSHPGRFLLGLGVSHGSLVDRAEAGTYVRPLAKMRSYLQALDQVPVDRRIVAAHGPRMLELAAAQSLGTHSYLVTPDHTRAMRESLGTGPIIAAEQAVVVERDPGRARAIARAGLKMYLGLANYTNNWMRIGFEPCDLDDGGSDRLVDALVAWGTADQVATRLNAHFEAGADHVCIQVLSEGDHQALPMSQWRAVAGAMSD